MAKKEDDIYDVGFDSGYNSALQLFLSWVRSLEYNFDQYGHEFKHREFIQHKIKELEKLLEDEL